MKLLCITLLLCITSFPVFSQVYDHFSDEEFTTDPEWSGDDSLFMVSSGELRLNATTSSEAHLVTAFNRNDSTQWHFKCRFALSPSTQNFCRFYLMSTSPDLEGPLNGYYVQLGGVTGNTDSITLYKQAGTQRTKIISGRPGTVSKTQNIVSVQVFRTSNGVWKLYSDTSGGNRFTLEGEASDNQFTSCAYLGWFVRYTSGNSQRFFLDEVEAYTPLADTTAPRIDSVVVSGKNMLMVYFNENLDSSSATHLTNYELSLPDKNPFQARLIKEDAVELAVNDSFVSKQTYRLVVRGVSDRHGNKAGTIETQVLYYVPELHDVLLSEWMADPTPAVGLPEYEFVELYNNTSIPINLAGFTLSDETSTAILPDVVLSPGSFIILCSLPAVAAFSAFGKAVGVSNMPSLNNSSDRLVLKDRTSRVIHEVSYNQDWYQDAEKKDGGWSIALNYPRQLCKGQRVYSASQSASGGTPGQVNILWNTTADTIPPGLLSLTLLNPDLILALFNEPMNAISLTNKHIAIQPTLATTSPYFSEPDSLFIPLQAPLANNTTYRLTIADVADCSENRTTITGSLDYYEPDPAASFDVLINEIMADPDPAQQLPNAEYVELYNRSKKVISLKGWTLSDAGSTALLPDVLIFPDSILVLCGTSNAPLFQTRSVALPRFPSLGNDGDELTLRNAHGQVIHAVAYSSGWYRDGLKQEGGWSLELGDPQNPCGQMNWNASKNQRGGTPGEPNSVQSVNRDVTPPRLIRGYIKDSSNIALFFTEPLDSSSFATTRFMLKGSIFPEAVSGSAPFYQSTTLSFQAPLLYHTAYSLIVDSITDCAGNSIEDFRSIDLERANEADSSDLVINEVLFNPFPGSFDFVELYNRSKQAVDLKGLLIGRREESGLTSGFVELAPEGFLLPPGAFVVFTDDPSSLLNQYQCRYPEHIIPVTLPPFNDDRGTVVLLHKNGRIYDEFRYEESMHFPLLDNPEGVSLERIDHNRPTDESNNWTSASASSGYATPTYQNSQRLEAEAGEKSLRLQPATISPDGDGYQDIMNINYNLGVSGFIGTLEIFDASGSKVRSLLRNEVLGSSGSYTWDGIMDNGDKAPVGIYLFYLEAFNQAGSVKKHKAVGVVAVKL